MDESAQVINFLLTACKQKDAIIQQLNKQLQDLTAAKVEQDALSKPS